MADKKTTKAEQVSAAKAMLKEAGERIAGRWSRGYTPSATDAVVLLGCYSNGIDISVEPPAPPADGEEA